ncbi:MAG: hypothetical protein AB1585_13515 [Thermodesulfobacteriota bacterium]
MDAVSSPINRLCIAFEVQKSGKQYAPPGGTAEGNHFILPIEPGGDKKTITPEHTPEDKMYTAPGGPAKDKIYFPPGSPSKGKWYSGPGAPVPEEPPYDPPPGNPYTPPPEDPVLGRLVPCDHEEISSFTSFMEGLGVNDSGKMPEFNGNTALALFTSQLVAADHFSNNVMLSAADYFF